MIIIIDYNQSDDSLSNLHLDDDQRTRFLESMRLVEESDIERVKNVQSNKEYFDVYKDFKLYYLSDLDEMKDQERALVLARKQQY